MEMESDRIKCPYCGDSDTDIYREDGRETETCANCGKEFILDIYTDTTYTTYRLDEEQG